MVVEEWRKKEVSILRSIPKGKFEQKRMRAVIYCGDMFRAMEAIGHLRELMVRDVGGNPNDVCCSPFGSYGGPLNLNRKLPTTFACTAGGKRVDLAATLELQLEQAVSFFGMDLLTLYAHAPCAIAGLNDLSAPEVMRHVIDGGDEKISTYPEIRELEFLLHVDYDGAKRKTYEFDRGNFEPWYERVWPIFRIHAERVIAASQPHTLDPAERELGKEFPFIYT